MDKQSKKVLKEQYRSMPEVGGVYCIRCKGLNKIWIKTTANMQGAKNRFEFLISTNHCPEPGMIEAWKQFGAAAFSLEVLEEIKKKETQTNREFSEDVDTLLEIWREKLDTVE